MNVDVARLKDSITLDFQQVFFSKCCIISRFYAVLTMEIRTDEFIPMLLLNELTDWQRNSVKINFTAYACHQMDVTNFSKIENQVMVSHDISI